MSLYTGTERRREQGFTLVELLVVIVIMAILMSVAIPAFLGLSQKGLKSAVPPLTATLRLARQYAVTQRRTVWVIFPDGAGTLYQGDNKSQVEKAWRAYAVLASNSASGQIEYITDWKYLPSGICFGHEQDGNVVMASVDESGSGTDFRFPSPDGPVVSVPAIMFRPDGQCAYFEDSSWQTFSPTIRVPLWMGVVMTDTNAGTAQIPTYSSATSVNVRVWTRTGQIDVTHEETAP